MAKGEYKVQRPEKYIGDVSKVFYRSAWELRFFQFCENNPNVVRWGSEVVKIKYLKPTDKKIHIYIPDIYIEYYNVKGELVKEIIEIKPMKEAKYSKKASTWDKVAMCINEAKWKAATALCEKAGIKFRVITEKSLFKTAE